MSLNTPGNGYGVTFDYASGGMGPSMWGQKVPWSEIAIGDTIGAEYHALTGTVVTRHNGVVVYTVPGVGPINFSGAYLHLETAWVPDGHDASEFGILGPITLTAEPAPPPTSGVFWTDLQGTYEVA